MSLVRFTNNLPSFIDRFFDGNVINWSSMETTIPSVNVKETKDAFTLEVAAPGFEKGDFNIELDHDVLSISSEKKVENEEKEEGRYTRREYSYQSFSRSFSLPESANGEKIEASYKDGILSINIPKKEEAKPQPKKMIEIK